jgi:hypothetical protein
VWKDRSIGLLTAPGTRSRRGSLEAYERGGGLDILHTHTHPIVTELVDPTELLWNRLAFERGPDREHLGRRAVTART